MSPEVPQNSISFPTLLSSETIKLASIRQLLKKREKKFRKGSEMLCKNGGGVGRGFHRALFCDSNFKWVYFPLFFAVLGTEPRASHILGQHSTIKLYP